MRRPAPTRPRGRPALVFRRRRAGIPGGPAPRHPLRARHSPRPGGLDPEAAEDLATLAQLAATRLELRQTRAARDRLLAQRAVVADLVAALPGAGDRGRS
ncbi:hypothetical protein [Methylobacterium sp. WL1]|uniref:hypothetical protein n=1 Tax=Methylobacterium sp. WL1 TaxID=2603276 RepID=UPI0011C1D9D3|nr:hypothetical protein [Methylobacterium sp. WL1]QEE38868.1 hypothetical protein FVA80_07725 [Methylobacterium sp. WL1]